MTERPSNARATITRTYTHPDLTSITDHKDQVVMQWYHESSAGTVTAQIDRGGFIETSVSNHMDILKTAAEFQRCIGELVIYRAGI